MTIKKAKKGNYFIAFQTWNEKITIIAINKNKFEASSICFMRVCKAFNEQ